MKEALLEHEQHCGAGVHLAGLDVLRSAAVISVLAFHAGYLDGGYLGVNLFFVLSGFLITRSLSNRSFSVSGIPQFYYRRFRRLAPVFALAVVSTQLLAPYLYPDTDLVDLRADGRFAVLQLSNWRSIDKTGDYWAALKTVRPFEHTWSLSAEEQMYFGWPIVFGLAVLLVRRTRLKDAPLVLGAGVSLVSLVVVVSHLDTWTSERLYYGTDARVWGVGLGAIMASATAARLSAIQRLERSVRVIGFVSLAAVIVTIGLSGGGLTARSQAALFLAFEATCALLIFAASSSNFLSAPQTRPGIRSFGSVIAIVYASLGVIGRASYSIYLWHWPIFLAVDERFASVSGLTSIAIKLAATAVAATSSYWLIESPIQQGRVRPFIWVVPTLLLLFFAIGLGSSSPHSSDDPPTLGSVDFEIALQQQAAGVRIDYSTAQTRVVVPGDAPAVQTQVAVVSTDGEPRSVDIEQGSRQNQLHSNDHERLALSSVDWPARLLLIGDSQASALSVHTQDHIEVDIKLFTAAVLGCGVLSGIPESGGTTYPETLDGVQCSTINDTWSHVTDVFRPDITVVYGGAWDLLDQRVDGELLVTGTKPWNDFAQKEVHQLTKVLQSSGSVVVWLRVPCFEPGPSTDQIPERLDQWRIDALNDAITSGLEDTGAVLLPFDQLFCPSGLSAELRGPERWDGVHLSGNGAVDVWDWLLAELDAPGYP